MFHDSRSEPIPHRRLALRILRSLRMGNSILHGGDSAFSIWLDGVPDVIHLFAYLQRNNYIEAQAETGIGAVRYVLTDAGRDLHERGESWWRSLSWRERLLVTIRG